MRLLPIPMTVLLAPNASFAQRVEGTSIQPLGGAERIAA
jgi:hypothetical protein